MQKWVKTKIFNLDLIEKLRQKVSLPLANDNCIFRDWYFFFYSNALKFNLTLIGDVS